MLTQSLLLFVLMVQTSDSGKAGPELIDGPEEPTTELLQFDLLRPDSMQADDVGPVLLALPPGNQSQAMVDAVHRLYWQEEALRLGWTVVSPIAPEGEGLYGDNLPRLHALIDHIESKYRVEGGKVHLAGISNGGRSAFDLALDKPERFASMSVLPGFPSDENVEQLSRLSRLPLAMYVGGDDGVWTERMGAMNAALREMGTPPARYAVFEGEGHTPKSLNGKLLFNALESFRVRSLLTDFHDAAAKADGSRYFEHFAAGGVFLGTDATERWSLEEFKAFAEPYFSKGQGWTYRASQRNTLVSEDGNTAWFDELLDNASYGVTRGTGVWVRQENAWRLVQYHLTIPVPNDLAKEFVERIRAEHKE